MSASSSAFRIGVPNQRLVHRKWIRSVPIRGNRHRARAGSTDEDEGWSFLGGGGSVSKSQDEALEQLKQKIAADLGYKIVGERLELYCVPLDDDREDGTPA